MEDYAGIDVSLESVSVCVVDATGRIVREAKVASEPDALIAWFGSLGFGVARIGLEAGPLPQWLYAAMKRADLAVELLETHASCCKLHDVEMSLRGILRGFGLKVGKTTARTFEARIRELVEAQPTLSIIATALLAARAGDPRVAGVGCSPPPQRWSQHWSRRTPRAGWKSGSASTPSRSC